MLKKTTQLIALHEGFRAKPYTCSVGKLTIAYGRNLDDVGLSREEGEMLLANDIHEAVSLLRDNLSYFDALSTVRQAVLVDMCFNLGWPRLAGFKKYFAALAVEDFSEATAEMLDSTWAHQVKQRAWRLADMMRSNTWPEEVQNVTVGSG